MWLLIGVLIGLSLTITANAQAPTEKFSRDMTLYKPACDAILHPMQDKEDCFYKAPVPKPIIKKHACNCVLWAQANGLDISGYGAAKNYPVTSSPPEDVGFVVTYEGTLGHIAKYTRSGDYLILDEANYVECTITSGRKLPINSQLIKGYIPL